jgi:curli biogenesis system outer membrane secretion channel CsgG
VIHFRSLIFALNAAAVAPLSLVGQVAPASLTDDLTPPASLASRITDKPSLVVMGFESGTVSAQIQDRHGFMAILSGMNGGEREKYDPSQLGIGIADMLVEKLLETKEFRLMERNEPGAVKSPAAQYVISGSVTKFGFEETNVGGAFANIATMGLLSYKQHKTEVALTARVINTATGEIVASFSSEGVSNKGGGLRLVGIGGGAAGGGDVSRSNFRATAIGQATGRAVNSLAEKLVKMRPSF